MQYAIRFALLRSSRPLAAAALAAILGLASAPTAAAQMARTLETSKNWSIHAPTDTPVKVCFASTAPIDTKTTKRITRRGKAFLLVATFPQQDVEGQIAVTLGFRADANKPLTLRVDDQNYKLFSEGADAWLDSPEDDAKVVRAMRAGAKAFVTATSASTGNRVTDEFSLVGFTVAERRSRELCA
ncbi:MAG: invasion associated locus B family protein [Pseudomonadota bacterium]